MALNCAILSYNGTAYFGFSGDVHAVPDLRRLEALLMSSFKELRDAAGVTPAQKKEEKKAEKRVPAKAKVAAAKAPAPVPVRASIPLPPRISVKSPIAPVPSVTEEKVLTQMIA
jgi:hypothetical protein